MASTLELDNILASKRYVNEGSKIQFMHPGDIINPFLDTLNFDPAADVLEVKTSGEVVNENEDGSKNIAYPRFLLSVNKGHSFSDYDNTFGVIVAMNLGQPIMKVYSGQEAKACTNLCIWNASDVFQQSLNSDINFSIQTVKQFFERKEEQIEEYRQVHQHLVDTYWNRNQLFSKLGELLVRSHKSKLGTGPIVGASRHLQDVKSRYYAMDKEETSLYNVYNAITQAITDGGDLVGKPHKTLVVGELLGLN